MNKANLKSYAPKARLDFIKAVTERANMLGITASGAAPAQVRGDVAIIEGTEWPAKVAAQRDQLIARMQREGFAQTCEAVAYTWFNRFAALRYMELHDYLGHGQRALSSSTGNLPDILTHAADLAQSGAGSGLPSLNAAKVVEMKLAGNRDGELYRMLLVAQCNALNAAMPFLFERIDDDTELLLPDNLLRTDSVIAKLVQEIPEEDWAEVEVIGWLYQFYISEKKDQVTGKVVKSEDIPAATQLFTPNWIVQYLVQNSVGRLWLMANPASTLAGQWPYYIQPAEQTPEVQAQLDALIQTRMDEDGGSLNPETITVLDPACGSGHILVVAYDVLKAIYLERGYQARAIPRLILEKNLYGLDIDDRAAQMAGFALLMKARADDRRLFNEPPKLNVLSLQESKGLDASALAQAINAEGTERVEVTQLQWLVDTFEHAKTFGSLIKVDHRNVPSLLTLLKILKQSLQAGDLYAQAAAQDLLPLVQQARLLGMRFDVVSANPPYMGARSFNARLKEYLKKNYSGFDKDLFSAFIAQSLSLNKSSGSISIMTSFVWMFINSFENLRRDLTQKHTLSSLVQLEYDAFEDAKAHICAFVSLSAGLRGYSGNFIRLADFKGAENQGPKTLEAIKDRNCGWHYVTNTDEFEKIPGSPVAYWIKGFDLFLGKKIGDYFYSGGRNKTHNNEKYLRFWWEVSSAVEKWQPYSNGGDFRKFYGNEDCVIDWSVDARNFYASHGGLCNEECWGKPGITWSLITSAITGFREKPSENQYSSGSPTIFRFDESIDWGALAFFNSKVARYFLKAINPTINTTVNDVLTLPYPQNALAARVAEISRKCTEIARTDWDGNEYASSFDRPLLVAQAATSTDLAQAYLQYKAALDLKRASMRSLETECNQILIDNYGLQMELTSEVSEEEITLACADRENDCRRLISYAIGCMLGRYSLDESGLIYAHTGNVSFDPSRYATFPADADGIVPLTDEHWFPDDAATRMREFLLAVWGADTLEENMAWLAESLGTKASETPDEAIRRYLADKFFKDHLQTYKKRPIYWLFSSGKQGAFQALVYLHRYTEGTLARLRAEYVVPLIAKVVSRLEMLGQDVAAASSAAARTKLQKQIEALRKKQIELLAYDEKLRHYADMRITLDLDDGVKVNYGKFGDLLDGVKLVTGGAGDD